MMDSAEASHLNPSSTGGSSTAKRTRPYNLISCRLIQLDQEWVPHCESSSLYIRPTMIGTEAQLGVAPAHEAELFVILSPVGPYFSTGVKPVNLVSLIRTRSYKTFFLLQ